MTQNEEFACPYCASPNTFSEDVGSQTSIECVVDCEVCCRPIALTIKSAEGGFDIFARPENEWKCVCNFWVSQKEIFDKRI